MIKNQSKSYSVTKGAWQFLFIVLIGIVVVVPVFYSIFQKTGYSFFLEFNDANGIKIGTPLYMRGVYIGFVQKVQLKLNCVLVLVKIDSSETIILRNSVIETTQTGLLNDSIIDIIPEERFFLVNDFKSGPSSSSCNNSIVVCPNTYVLGDRGLNYDDLVRSTTRISQRFDDPRIFNLFYTFLRNTIQFTAEVTGLIEDISDLFFIFCLWFEHDA